MFRYVAFAWNSADAAQCETAKFLFASLSSAPMPWRRALDVSGLSVFYTGDGDGANESCLLHGGAGVVLGTLFERVEADGSVPAKAVLGRAATERIMASRGRELLHAYWGRYVAFLREQATGRQWVIREPAGALECLTTTFRGVHLFFSSMRDCPVFDRLSFSVNWQYVTTAASTFMMETRATGLGEVTRVLRGECVELARDAASRAHYWHPFSIASSDQIENPTRAAQLVRITAKACVQAWASRYEAILHLLSGGLDSSIVLGCMQDKPRPQKVTCLNYYYTRGSNSDERTFARLAAHRAGSALIEREIDPSFALEPALDLPRSASPTDCVLELGVLRIRSQVVRECGARAVFTGDGGDELFYKNVARLACADYLRRRGFRPALFSLALNVARMGSTSVWRALRAGVRDAFFRDPMRSILDNRLVSGLLRPDAAEAVRQGRLFLNPWLSSPHRIPPGKLWQIYALSHTYRMYGTYSQPGDPEFVAPLMSQPLMELCLRVPTYVHGARGWDRAMARQAFVRELPKEIVARRTKCVVDHYMNAILERNRVFIRNLLLDGILAQQHVIDRQKLEYALAGNPAKDFGFPLEIFSLVSAEVWLRRWRTTAQRAAA